MLHGWLDAGVSAERFTVVRASGVAPAPGLRTLTELPVGEPAPAIVMLGVKPVKIDAVAPALAPLVAPETVLVSILAGVEIASLRARVPGPTAVVRAMPNLPVRLRAGVTGLFADGLGEAGRAEISALMGLLGLAEWVRDEAALDAVSVLAGSGPAFVYRFIDALAAAGAEIGLGEDQARRLALATAEGAVMLAAGAEASPAVLADRVASPGGSTRKGLDVLDEADALRRLLSQTLAASRRRVAEMATEARA
jgi:pyrroline-5-carboxylate reductase